MSDLYDSLSDTDDTAMPIALECAKPAIISCAIAHSNGDPVTTETEIAITANPTKIAPALVAPGSTNPYLVYLSQLAIGSRRTMRESLEHIARMVSEGSLDASNFPWSELRYQHTQAIYTHLLETRAPATANKMMAAVGRVLKCCLEVGADVSRRLSPRDRNRTTNGATATQRQSIECRGNCGNTKCMLSRRFREGMPRCSVNCRFVWGRSAPERSCSFRIRGLE